MKISPLKILFAGTPEFAATHLQAIIDSEHQICGVYTQPDRPAGRGQVVTASPVKQLALENNLLICQPQTLKTAAARSMLRSFEADIMVVVAYGLILPVDILDIPRLGCINVHASLLPRWRGAAPIQRAIEAGDKQTGVTIMQMDAGLDTGEILLKSSLAIDIDETSASLHLRLMKMGATTLIEALQAISKGQLTPTPQDSSSACYATKLSKTEAAIDWSLSAEQLIQKARALTPWPGSYVSLDGQKMNVIVQQGNTADGQQNNIDATTYGTILSADETGIRVQCKQGCLLITSLQIPGKKMTTIAALLNAYNDRFLPGKQFDP